jgi:sugar phosphate isomerase/epimerase
MSHKYSLVHLTCISCPPPAFIRTAAAAGYDYVSLRTIPMKLPNEVPHLLTDRVLLEETRAASLETGVKINDTENARIFDGVDVQEYEPHLAAAAELGIKHILCNIWTADRTFYTQKFGELCQLSNLHLLLLKAEGVFL